MYPKRMKWVDVYLLRSDLNRTLDRLHDVQIIQIGDKTGMKDLKIDPFLLEAKNRLDKIIDFLVPMEPKKKGILAPFLDDFPDRYLIETYQVGQEVKQKLKKMESEVQPLRERIDRIHEDRAYISELKERLMNLTGLDVDLLAVSSLSRIRIKIGTTRRYSELLEKITPLGGDLEGSLLDKKEGIHSVRVLYTKTNSDSIEDVLRGRLFSDINLDIPRMKKFFDKRTGSH